MNESTHQTDRRIQRTRAALKNALLDLLPEKGWDELSVLDICERADIGRSTFYLHFRGKDELLTVSLDELRQALTVSASGADDGHCFGFLPGLLAHVAGQRRLSRAIMGRRSGHVVQQRFREMIAHLVADSLVVRPAGAVRRDAVTAYLSGALVDMLVWWIDARPAMAAGEFERTFAVLSGSAVAALTDRHAG